jgi:large subunit ribosomal protein L25
MERIDLKVQLREETGKGPAHRCRQKGLIPGVFYGPKVDSIPLTITQTEFKKALKGKVGENIIINLTVEGKEDIGPQVAMIRDFQVDLIKRDVIHIDLQQIDLEKKITVAVPIELIGKAEGVKLGGILQQVERELEIRCMPLAIPERFEVDVSSLLMGESIHVREIAVPEGIEVLSSGEQTVVTVLSPKLEVEKVVEEVVEEGETVAEKEDKTKESEA